MSFPLGLLLIPYLLVVLLSLLLAVLNVYHLVHYGATTKTSFLFTFVFVAGLVVIAVASWLALGGINWGDSVGFSLFGGGPDSLPQF
jgi:hypothetical protein